MTLPSRPELERMDTRELLALRTELDNRENIGPDEAAAIPQVYAVLEARKTDGASLDRDERSESLETTTQTPGETGENGSEDGLPELPACADHWWNLVCNHDATVVTVPNRCRRRTCPDCAHKRYLRLMQEYEPLLHKVQNPKLLTVTLRRGDDLELLVDRLVQGFKNLRRRDVMAPVRGGFYAIEVVPKPDGEWHVHLHALIDAPFIEQEDISDEWRDITGDSYVVDIRKLANQEAGVRYVLGYTTKREKIERDWCDESEDRKKEFEDAIKGRRFLQPWGSLYGVDRCEHSLTCPTCQKSTWSVAEFDRALMDQLGLVRGRHPSELEHDIRRGGGQVTLGGVLA